MAEWRAGVAAAVSAAALLASTGCGATRSDQAGDRAGVVSEFSSSDRDGLNGAVLDDPYRWPTGTLVDTSGEPLDLRADLEKPLTLVFFGYTHCPDICQAVMADLASAKARLDPAEAEQVATWFVTTDPARDDPAVLREYLDRFDPTFEGLTGPLPDIVDAAKQVHLPIEKGRRLPSGGYEVVHGTAILGVRPDGTVPIVWTEGTSAAKLAEDLHSILTDGIPVPTEEGS